MAKSDEDCKFKKYSIITLLQTHPVSRKDNLKSIAEALDLEYEEKDTKTDLTLAIENSLNAEPELETKVREIAITILAEYNKQKADITIPKTSNLSRSPVNVYNTPNSSSPAPQTLVTQSQDLFCGTANDSFLSVSQTASQMTAKRNLFPHHTTHTSSQTDSENETMKSDSPSIIDNLVKMCQKQNEQVELLLGEIHTERSLRAKEQMTYESQLKNLNDVLSGFCNRIEKTNSNVAELRNDVKTRFENPSQCSCKTRNTSTVSQPPQQQQPPQQ